MAKELMTHRLILSRKEVKQASDMLRYDGAYTAHIRDDKIEVFTITYTPERWKSFNVSPVEFKYKEINCKLQDLYIMHEGFMEALMLVQELWANELGTLTERRIPRVSI